MIANTINVDKLSQRFSEVTKENNFDIFRLEVELKKFTSNIPYNPYYEDILPTTMAIKEYFKERNVPLKEGLVLIAGDQTNGVGNSGKWESMRGNVLMTLLLDTKDKDEFHLLQPTIALSVIEAVRNLSNSGEIPEIKYKWPNDIRTHSNYEQNKFCGILVFDKRYATCPKPLESIDFPEAHTVVGIGVNLVKEIVERQINKDGNPAPVTSLEALYGRKVTREVVILEILKQIEKNLMTMREDPYAISQKAFKELAVGDNNLVLVDTNNYAGKEMRVLGITTNSILFNCNGKNIDLPFAEVKRIIPSGYLNNLF